MPLSLEELWIKAAVEHRLVTVSYVNPETRLVYNKRDIRPDWIGPDKNGTLALWGLLNHNPFVGMKSFSPQFFQYVKLTNDTFQPLPNGRWKELQQTYAEKQLDQAALE
jgi:hypothetical protein